MKATLTAMLGAALACAAAPALAHHAFAAEFDATKPVTLQGTITRVEWINPHAWIHLDVEGDDGAVESWMIEAGSPNTLVRRGMSRDSILPGTEVVVFGYRHRNGSNAANGRDVTLPDGTKLFLSSPRTGAPGGDEP
ncbi:MAG: hypothetical protein JXB36_16780 [Gammaproteobacteria bacterium]|nr:hypothetical protein [Gammaproteobacteria bacterium]